MALLAMQKQMTTVGSSTYEAIKHDIVFGKLEPGSKLKLERLRAEYSVSVSILRETLSRLASEGFVTAEEQRGFFVASISNEDLMEIADLRILLECTALRTSIAAGDAEWEGNLVAAHHKLHLMEAKILAGDTTVKETWKRYDWEFHLATIQACRSRNLLDLHAIIFDKYLRYQMLVLTNRGADAVAEHKALLDAALARDTSAAQCVLEAHIRNGLHHTLDAMSSTQATAGNSAGR